MAHTKGPWMVFDGPNGAYWIGPENYHSIAEVRNGGTDKEYGGPEREEANARLIASAPELLEACKEVLKFMGKEGWEWSAENKERAGLPWAKIQSVIAKAEGRQ